VPDASPSTRSGAPGPGRPPGRRPAAGGLLVLAVLGLVLSACGSGSPSATGSTSTTHHDTTSTVPASSVTAPPITTPTVTINGQTFTVPTDQGGTIRPFASTGTNIVLSPKGFLPHLLIVFFPATVTWTNLTPHTVTFRILYSKVKSPPVPPGGTWQQSYTTSDSFNYVSSTGYRAAVSVGAFQS